MGWHLLHWCRINQLFQCMQRLLDVHHVGHVDTNFFEYLIDLANNGPVIKYRARSGGIGWIYY